MDYSQANKNLFLATMAFVMSFALWGLISGLAPLLKTEYGLTVTQTSIAVAIPVVLGSLGRIPMGVLTDRIGGRLVFTALLLFGLVPALALAIDHSYGSLLAWGFFLGLMGSSFAIGIGFVSPWFPQEKQGTALGLFGVGNMGQSLAVFGGPLLAATIGINFTFLTFGLASLLWGLVFLRWAQNAMPSAPPKTVGQSLQVLREEPIAWVLSVFYFLTFGGFVALGVFLPTLLKDFFHLEVADAGARTAGFVILATVARPFGGWLADRIGGRRLLLYVFSGLAVLAWFLLSDSIYLFTAGALGIAIGLGLGNGGVFKLVPKFFPKQTGTVTGLVGAAGGLGGFFPPIVLGVLRDNTGGYAGGYLLLSAFALGCLVLLWLFPAFREGRQMAQRTQD